MAEVEQALTSEADGVIAEPPRVRQPRKLIEIIPSQLETLRASHRAVLDTEGVEAVHKMRVTTRRLQASLDLLEREMKVRKLKKRLRDWRRALSSVRNYDVFLELVENEAANRGKARREHLQLVKNILQQRRVRRAEKIRKLLEGIDLDKMAIRLGITAALTAQTPASPGDIEGAAGETDSTRAVSMTMTLDETSVATYAADRLDQRVSEFQALAAQSHPTNDPSELHQLRIAAKRVRYLLEIVSAMGFGDASRALSWLRALQDRIGDWHDLEALEEEIIAIVSSHEFMKEHLSESSRMLQAAAHLQKKKLALVARLFPVRPPRYLEITTQRIARALRRASVQSNASAQ